MGHPQKMDHHMKRNSSTFVSDTIELANLTLNENLELHVSQKRLQGVKHVRMLYDCRGSAHINAGLYCTVSNSFILCSYDNGDRWSKVFDCPEGKRIVSFIATQDYYIIEVIEPLEVLIVSNTGTIIERMSGPFFSWHGSQGADVSKLGVTLFSEYQTHNKNVNLSIWKHERRKYFIRPVLTKRVGKSREDGDIRHFHTCIADPYEEGRWYASSGDLDIHCRFWTTQDDGESWKELKVNVLENNEFTLPSSKRFLRFTSATVTQARKLLWATDDLLGIGRSAVVEATIEKDQIYLSVIDLLSNNNVRNIISHDQGHLLITEAKYNVNFIFFHWLTLKGKVVKTLALDNISTIKSPVTVSVSSKYFIENIAFIPSLGVLYNRDKRCVFKLQIKAKGSKNV
jgi:hypothetical protein